MVTVEVLTTGEGKKKGVPVELDPAIFDAPLKPHLFHAEVRRQLARRRAGTHSSKNRSAVSGGGAKPWRQKGTGRARQGTNRAPQWVGGGVVFGPVPRRYEHKLPKKVRRAALCSALSHRLREGAVSVVEELVLSEYKTKSMLEIVKGLGLEGKSLLIVIGQAHPQVEISARNLRNVSVLRAEGLNVYDLLRHSKLLFTREALSAIEARLGKKSEAGA